jgi:hypothetical protein
MEPKPKLLDEQFLPLIAWPQKQKPSRKNCVAQQNKDNLPPPSTMGMVHAYVGQKVTASTMDR